MWHRPPDGCVIGGHEALGAEQHLPPSILSKFRDALQWEGPRHNTSHKYIRGADRKESGSAACPSAAPTHLTEHVLKVCSHLQEDAMAMGRVRLRLRLSVKDRVLQCQPRCKNTHAACGSTVNQRARLMTDERWPIDDRWPTSDDR